MNKLIAQLQFEEGLRLSVYLCTAGKRTIGNGHNLDAKPNLNGYKIPEKISKHFAYALLLSDIADLIREIDLKASWILDLQAVRRDAFLNMAFQLGVNGLLKFKMMLKAADQELWNRAADMALDSTWARQTPERAERIAEQIRTGVYYECKR